MNRQEWHPLSRLSAADTRPIAGPTDMGDEYLLSFSNAPRMQYFPERQMKSFTGA